MASCRACGAPIRFAQHVKTGKAHPVDETPSTAGNLVLFHEGAVLKCRHAQLPADQMRPRHKSHFATCTSPAAFRRSSK
jgi:hypothetical protein